MSKPTVVIYTDEKYRYWQFPVWLYEELQKDFPQLHFVLSHGNPPLEDLISEADILITGRFPRELFPKAKKLKWIHSPFAGVGNMLFEEMVNSSIIITNSRGINAEAVALHAVTLSLALLRGLPYAFALKTRKEYNHAFFTENFMPVETSEVIAGIMGFGQVGSRVAKMLSGMGFRTFCLRRKKENTNCEKTFLFEQLEEFLRQINLLIITAPLTEKTCGLIDLKRMNLLSGFLVNVARGKIVVEEDLVKALQEGVVKGAALDVFEKEPLSPESPLWEMDNVIITPHIAGTSSLYWGKMKELLKEQFKRFLQGKQLLNVVDKREGY